MPSIKKSFVFLSAILFATAAFADKEFPYRRGVVRHRLSFAPVASFYKNTPDMAINTKAQSGFCASYKVEIFSGKKTNLLIGLEYFDQGFSFQGYYAAPGYTYAFDKTFAYSHTARVREIDVPMGLKVAFNIEEDNYFTPYFSGGFCPRYIINSSNLIVNDSTGITVHEGNGNVDFENNIGLLTGIPNMTKLNGFLYGGLGAQYNFRGSAKALFFEITYKYGLSRFNYHGYNNSNNLFIKNSNLAFIFGIRF